MIIVECVQGSEEWFQHKMGVPSASNFDRIITPGGKASTQAEGYMNRLLAEWLTGKASDIEQSEWMKRGIEMEAEARDFYAFQNDAEVKQVGLVYQDDRKRVSCSPDGLLDGMGLEIKCPAPHTHVGYLLDGDLPKDYIPQVQGSMYVTGLSQWTFMSYHPDMTPLVVTVKRNEEYIKAMDGLIVKFLAEMNIRREKLQSFKRAK